jgi:hypothetical protein
MPSAPCPLLYLDPSALKQWKLSRSLSPKISPYPSRTTKISFQVWIFTLADQGRDSKPLPNPPNPLISFFSNEFWKEFRLCRRGDHLPFLCFKTGIDQLLMKRRKFLHQLLLNGRPMNSELRTIIYGINPLPSL